MKKIFYSIMALAIAAFTFVSCEDVPAPYDIPGKGGVKAALPMSSLGLADFSLHAVTEAQPWSQGSAYTQATGYQDWDGTGTKSNKEAEGYLISPVINTTVESGKVYFSFDHTIRYTNNVSGWEGYHKIFISKNYDGTNFDAATWEAIAWTPKASTYSDWTLYTSGDIAIPDAYVNQEKVYIAFYFKAPASASTTWELKNFYVAEGEGGGSADEPDTPAGDVKSVTCAEAAAIALALEDKASTTETYTVTGYITSVVGSVSKNQQTFWMADTKDGGQVFEAYWANLPEGVAEFKAGSKVAITGNLMRYGTTAEMKNADVVILEEGSGTETPSNPGTATGSGTQTDPYNVAAAIKFISGLDADVKTTETYYAKGKVCKVVKIGTSGSIQFYMSDDGKEDNSLLVYYCNDIDNKAFASVDDLKVGEDVVVCGTVVNYKGNTPEFNSGSYLVSRSGNGGSTGGNDNPSGGSSDAVVIDGTTVTLNNAAATAGTETVTLVVNDLGIEDKASVDGKTYNFSDGTTLTVTKSDGSSAPVYNSASNGFRIYASNVLAFNSGSKTIAKIVMECDEYSGTKYVGNATATFSVSGSTATYCNFVEGNKGGVQLRVKKFTVTYAK